MNYLQQLNIRSLNQNLTKLTDFLKTLNLDLSIIGISETWLDGKNQNCDYVGIEGYNFVHESRTDRSGGGVGLFVNNNINFKLRPDLSTFDSQIMESLFTEIIRPKLSNIIIWNIYRPPNSNMQMFIDKMNTIMSKVTNEQKECLLLGDFNIDLLRYNQHNITNDFLDTMFSHSFLPTINRPARITSHTATSIDNIFSNCLAQNDHTASGILFADISDHLPVFTLILQQNQTDENPTVLTRRLINQQTKKQFSK